MRIESLYIDGFGHFNQRTFGPFGSSVTIFDGENEAGKSTLLAFIRTVLYGFPSRGRDEHYPPIRGGRHGGHIVVTDEVGARYTVQRYAAARRGDLNIKGEDGTSFPEAKLRDLLGHSSKEMFENYFAFGLDELREMNSSDGEEVRGRIYSAALGAIDLVGAQKTIEGNKDSIFLTSGRGGRNQKTSDILNQLDDVENQLLSHRQDAPRYAALTDRVDRIVEEIASLEAKRIDLGNTLDHQGKLLAVRDDLIEMSILEAKLSGLAESPQFPQDGVPRLENLIGQVARLEEAVHQATEDVGKLEEVVATPLDGAALLESAEAIRKSTSESARLQNAVKDLPERMGEVNEKQAEFTRLLSDLGSDWDGTRLEAIDVSLPIRDLVNQEKDRILGLRQMVANRQNDKESAEKEFRTADDAVKQAEAELEKAGQPAHDETGLAKRRATINVARNAMARLSESQLRRAQLQAAGGHGAGISVSLPIIAIVFGLVVLGVSSGTWGFIGNGGMFAIWIGAFSLSMSVGLSILAYLNRKPAAISTQTTDVEYQIVKIEEELADAKKILGLDSVDSSRLMMAEEELDVNNRQWNDVQNMERIHRDAIRAAGQRKQELESASDTLTEAEDQTVMAEDGWKAWLKDRGLMETMSGDGVLELFSKVDAARSRFSSLRDLQDRVSAIQHDIEEICDLVAPLAQKHGVPFNVENPATFIPSINELSVRLESAQGEQKARELERQSLIEAKERVGQENRGLANAQDDLKNLLKLGDTDDPEEFRRIAVAQEEYQKFHNEMEGFKTTIRRVFAVETDAEALRAEIGERSTSALEESVQGTKSSLDEVERKRDELKEESTLAERELSELGASDQASELLARRETYLEELRELGMEWSKYSLALLMLRKARDHHERERQPKVVQTASEFFKDITGARYSGLRVPAGESTVIAVTAAGEGMQTSQLSRGTKEQMYLSLKLGAIQESSQQNTPLPVIVDDALVNSDPNRAGAAAAAIAKLGDTNQVLVFTCHPTLVQQFQEACPEAEVQKLSPIQGS